MEFCIDIVESSCRLGRWFSAFCRPSPTLRRGDRFMRRLAVAALATLPLTLLTVSSVSADTVTDWNLKATAAIKTAGIGPNPSTRALAITHIAIHDALVAISKAYKPYKTTALVPAG